MAFSKPAFLLLIFGCGSILGWATPGRAQVPTATMTQTPDCCQQAWVTNGESAAATLNGLGNLAVSTDTVYVPDLGGNQIQKFDLNGQPTGVIGGFNGPYCVALGPSEMLAVGEVFNGDIKLYDFSSQTTSRTLSVSGDCRSLWVDPNGDLYATISFNSGPGQVDIFQWTGSAYNSTPVTFGAGMGTLPTGLVKLVNGAVTTLYVADATATEVLEYTQGISYSFGTPVTVTANIPLNPNQMAVGPQSDLYISGGNSEYSVFTGSLSLIYSCSSILSMTGLTTDTAGAVYVAGFWNSGSGLIDEVQKYSGCPFAPTPTFSFAVSESCFIYPSPVRGNQATVAYEMAQAGRVEIKVWNQNGELVDQATDQKIAGTQSTILNLAKLAPGVYFYELVFSYDSGQTAKTKLGKFVVIH